jgi:hypothetical protein
MKFIKYLIGLILIGTFNNSFCQSSTDTFFKAINYDARLFLTKNQIVLFNRLYPEFDKSKAVKNWEWKDVDPLGLFTPEENRSRRRELFLFEYTPMTIENISPNKSQLTLKELLSKKIEGAQIIIDKSNLKILSPYRKSHELELSPRSLLEKLSDWGLLWGEKGGNNLYYYTGNVLIGKYKSGYVSLVDLNIDKPNNIID